ncbi:hypothetical protein L6452_21112 [Arctium lappa]|uniref:Uncharacterized protein n=1 Tax=Arctium lappa TaxID=4217 RepID=A0ACB9BCU1_ARCLA|nr:hypothetical protein L6452_21112 [Arctium lappa]
MSSPAQVPGRIPSRDSNACAVSSGGAVAVDFRFSDAGRPSSLVVTQASMFNIPPTTLLDSPGFFLPAQFFFYEYNGMLRSRLLIRFHLIGRLKNLGSSYK